MADALHHHIDRRDIRARIYYYDDGMVSARLMASGGHLMIGEETEPCETLAQALFALAAELNALDTRRAFRASVDVD